jgi:hypothetical protein
MLALSVVRSRNCYSLRLLSQDVAIDNVWVETIFTILGSVTFGEEQYSNRHCVSNAPAAGIAVL